jgi:hypothetical protein
MGFSALVRALKHLENNTEADALFPAHRSLRRERWSLKRSRPAPAAIEEFAAT